MVSQFVVQAQSSEEGFLKRAFNNMIARYNIYFNATQKFDEATQQLFEGHKDDFEEILPVYPYGDLSAAKSMRAPMEEVMKKASKVIQTKPKSKWVDDAYFLIGQTHFFRNDQFSAIEAFQFVYSKYSDPSVKAKSQLWVMKSYMRQLKYNDAEAILGLIRENPTSDRKIKAHVHLTAGDLYVNQGKYKLAIEELNKGARLTKDRTLRYRTNFILGQLHLLEGNYEKASEHYIKVIKANSPYDYVFQSNLGLTKATAQSGGKGLKSTRKNLKRMLQDDKNIDYFDQIYYELALLEFVEGNEEQGLKFLMESSANAGSNAKQKTKTYLFLADYFFEQRAYDRSQSYFDSAVSVLPQDYPDYSGITAKHAVLSRLIENISIIETQDSLLNLSELDREELDQRINALIEEQQRAALKAEEEEQLRQQRDLLNDPVNITASTTSGGVWYFYNASQVARGTNEFKKIWGLRAYGDYWRFANKSIAEDSQIDEPDDEDDTYNYAADQDEEQQEALADVDEDKLKYYENIPFSQTAKLLANQRIRKAMLAVGKIYYDDLKEYYKSQEFLTTLLQRYPASSEEPEAIFYMAKVKKSMGDTAAYDQYALQIAQEYPNTTFNQVLNSREIVESGESEEVINFYVDMYKAYEAGHLDRVKEIKELVAKEHAGNSIQAKFDYLYALYIGKTAGKEAYIEELKALVDNYPGTEIATKAAYTLRVLSDEVQESRIDISMFNTGLSGSQVYVLTGKTDQVSVILKELNEYNARFFPGTTLQIKSIEYRDKQMFYMKPFRSVEEVMSYHNDMTDNKVLLINSGLNGINHYAISEDNFKTLVKDGLEENYLIFFKRNYPQGL